MTEVSASRSSEFEKARNHEIAHRVIAAFNNRVVEPFDESGNPVSLGVEAENAIAIIESFMADGNDIDTPLLFSSKAEDHEVMVDDIESFEMVLTATYAVMNYIGNPLLPSEVAREVADTVRHEESHADKLRRNSAVSIGYTVGFYQELGTDALVFNPYVTFSGLLTIRELVEATMSPSEPSTSDKRIGQLAKYF